MSKKLKVSLKKHGTTYSWSNRKSSSKVVNNPTSNYYDSKEIKNSISSSMVSSGLEEMLSTARKTKYLKNLAVIFGIASIVLIHYLMKYGYDKGKVDNYIKRIK